jgi:hypothetical protein
MALPSLSCDSHDQKPIPVNISLDRLRKVEYLL